MRLGAFLREDFVLLDLDARDAEGVVRELSEGASRVGIGPVEAIQEKLLERERLHPTVMGSGLAIPHATVPGLDAPVIGVARAGGEGIPFGTAEQEPVRVFFVLLSPPGREREHVKLLARICRLVRHEGFLEELGEAKSRASVIEFIQRIDDQHV